MRASRCATCSRRSPFLDDAGTSPKTFARAIRFQRLLDAIRRAARSRGPTPRSSTATTSGAHRDGRGHREYVRRRGGLRSLLPVDGVRLEPDPIYRVYCHSRLDGSRSRPDGFRVRLRTTSMDIAIGLARVHGNSHGCCRNLRTGSRQPPSSSHNIHGCCPHPSCPFALDCGGCVVVSKGWKQYPWMLERMYERPAATSMDVGVGLARVWPASSRR